MKVVAIAGGTGSAKLLRGLQQVTGDFVVVSNVGDNFWHKGLYICPDIDIAVYTLSGMADEGKGWGIRGDTFRVLEQMKQMGQETWFNLGDRDLATHILRTERLREGKRLGEVTDELCRRLRCPQRVVPCSEDRLETFISVKEGGAVKKMHLQEFWVKRRGEPEVSGVTYEGAETARASEAALEVVGRADRIVFCPANPVTSIGPVLAVSDLRRAIRASRARKVAISPMIGTGPVSGPAGKMMKSLGLEADSLSVSRLLRDELDCIVIDYADLGQRGGIEGLGLEVAVASTLMNNREDERRLAEEVLKL